MHSIEVACPYYRRKKRLSSELSVPKGAVISKTQKRCDAKSQPAKKTSDSCRVIELSVNLGIYDLCALL